MATKSEKLLTNLRTISTRLREEDEPDLAGTVESLLEPTGWGALRRAIEAESKGDKGDAFPIGIQPDLHEKYKALSPNLTKDVIEGLTAFIDGTFSPAGYPRRGATGSAKKASLNVRLPAELKESFAAAAEARKAELGYTTTIGHVAKAWLAHKYAQPAQ
ncbi:hypothetical protein ACH4TP_37850 [Streptomyces sp. NPDC021012]|uniref:hypothetical protein n=1 Tax=Streptomyces sp. NPDC021012 TaxID=3365107 RepID=UPI0037A6DB97